MALATWSDKTLTLEILVPVDNEAAARLLTVKGLDEASEYKGEKKRGAKDDDDEIDLDENKIKTGEAKGRGVEDNKVDDKKVEEKSETFDELMLSRMKCELLEAIF